MLHRPPVRMTNSTSGGRAGQIVPIHTAFVPYEFCPIARGSERASVAATTQTILPSFAIVSGCRPDISTARRKGLF